MIHHHVPYINRRNDCPAGRCSPKNTFKKHLDTEMSYKNIKDLSKILSIGPFHLLSGKLTYIATEYPYH